MAIFDDTDLQGFSDLAMELGGKDTCQIYRLQSEANDGQGGEDNSDGNYESVATVQCFITDAMASGMASERAIAQQYDNLIMKRVYMPRLTDVRSADRLKIAGVTYEVAGLPDPTTFEAVRRVMVVERISQ